jgi:hypothetical protein
MAWGPYETQLGIGNNISPSNNMCNRNINSLVPGPMIMSSAVNCFLLFAIVLYFGFLLIYTFKAMFISGILYLIFIPISFVHYFKINKKNIIQDTIQDNHEDIL